MREFRANLRQWAIRCYLFTTKLRNKAKWYLEYLIVKHCRKMDINIPILDVNGLGRVLVIAPHADDELIGCYNLMKKSNNVAVYYCQFYGGNNKRENILIRDKEIEKFASKMNICLFNTSEKPIPLDALLTNEYFDTILLTSPYDWHPEHRKIAEMVTKALIGIKRKPVFYYYNVSMPFPSKLMDRSYSVRFSKEEQTEKWKRFYDVYVSQRHMPIWRYILQERLETLSPSEVYVIRSLSEIKNDILLVNNNPMNMDRMNKCIDKIGSIYEIRKQSWNNFGINETPKQ